MSEIPSILQRILETKAEEVAARSRRHDLATISAMALDQPPARGFARRITDLAASGTAVIAEVKKASPSAGSHSRGFPPG